MKELLDLLLKKKVLGRVVGLIYTVEFQKRGLPHVHILMIMGAEDKPHTSSDIDDVICAEIPDKNLHPKLYEIVTNCMLDGPCAKGKCLDDKNKCTKGYPKQFSSHTTMDKDGYPTYRRCLFFHQLGFDNAFYFVEFGLLSICLTIAICLFQTR